MEHVLISDQDAIFIPPCSHNRRLTFYGNDIANPTTQITHQHLDENGLIPLALQFRTARLRQYDTQPPSLSLLQPLQRSSAFASSTRHPFSTHWILDRRLAIRRHHPMI